MKGDSLRGKPHRHMDPSVLAFGDEENAMKCLQRIRSVSVIYLVLACLIASAQGEDDPRIARLDAFPAAGQATYIAGELTHVDHVNRTAILRPDRKVDIPSDFWDLPFAIQMLPYATIRYRGAPAELRDIPLGTHLHGEFYLGPKGAYEIKPPEFPDSPRIYYESQLQYALLLEDDFSFYERQHLAWKVLRVDPAKHQLVVERVSTSDATKSTQPEEAGMSGTRQFRIDRATRVWIGRQIGRLEDLAAGQMIQMNLSRVTILGTSYQKTVTDTPDDGLCNDLWIDEESRSLATEQQRQCHLADQHFRGVPAHVDFTESIPGAGARGYVTVTLHAGLDPELYAAFKEKSSCAIMAVEPTLRSYDDNGKGGDIERVTLLENPPPGSSGIQLRMHVHEMLEGFRRGRTVRLIAYGWVAPERPREERLWPVDVRVFRFGPKGVADREPLVENP